ncbi:MAG: response regulator [bacterium]|nr:response regulator [bacterium]
MQISKYKSNISKPILGEIDRESGGSSIIKGKTILLIDDEPMVTDICEMMLKRLGLKVLKAHSGSDGIKIYEAHKNRIDLIISDFDMPGMNGQEVVDELRVMDHRVKVLLSSGGLNQEREEEILGRGFNGFLKKPFSTNTLSDKIAELLK